jgi:hypothetical protein
MMMRWQTTVLVPFPNCLMGTRLSKDVAQYRSRWM